MGICLSIRSSAHGKDGDGDNINGDDGNGDDGNASASCKLVWKPHPDLAGTLVNISSAPM